MGDMFSSKEPKQTRAIEAPKVVDKPKDKKLAQIGRSSLISTSSVGLLGNAKTGRKQLSV